MRTVYLICTCFILGSVQAYISNKTYEGYPTGFLPDCPGAMKPAVISKKNLKYIQIYVSGAKAPPHKHRRMYTYDTIGEMAKDPTMDWSKRTLFYVGGFMDTINYPMGPTVEYYYKQRGYNVWILDCLRFMTQEYPVAVRYVPALARRVAEMISNVTNSNVGFDPKNFELAGFSIGAHIMSNIAKAYKNITGAKFRRLTGIDPTGICFRNLGPDRRIDKEDADYVDTYKTNIDNWGTPTPEGHVNFYFNGGEYQPGQAAINKCDVICSHFRAYFIFIAALQYDDQFIGVKCNSVQEARLNQCYKNKPLVTNVAGFNTDFSKPGIYYVATSNIYPYHIGKAGLKKGNDAFTIFLAAVNKPDVLVLASRAMMAVGKHVGEMIANVTASQPLFDPKKFDLIGISLGGQTMSFIAKSYTKLTGLKFSRMTGLDPAGPCFRNRGPEGRIDDSDADFVELVMTNIDGYGMAGPAGHINYYVNGGEIQPGDLYWMVCNTLCSHARVFLLWISSLIYPDSFIAMKCDNVQDARNSNCYDRNPMVTNVLGLNVDKNKTGIFYLATHNFFPFYLGKSGLKKKNNYVMRMLRNMNANDVLYM